MKKIIRLNTFETNSSSTHSLIMCTKETYEKWKSGELLFDKYAEKFVEPSNYSKEELKKGYLEKKVKTINNGILYENTYYTSIEELVDKVEVPEEELDKYAKDLDRNYDTYEEYQSNNSWDYSYNYEGSYTTPGGETIIAFGKYE